MASGKERKMSEQQQPGRASNKEILFIIFPGEERLRQAIFMQGVENFYHKKCIHARFLDQTPPDSSFYNPRLLYTFE
jgi:hypothetical protein